MIFKLMLIFNDSFRIFEETIKLWEKSIPGKVQSVLQRRNLKLIYIHWSTGTDMNV